MAAATKQFYVFEKTNTDEALVVCGGPSGSGKTTFLTRILNEHPAIFGYSVSHTTRNPRPGELNSIHYYFTEREVMEEAIKRGEFVEYATYNGNLYGTSKESILKVFRDGKVCILDIDVQGADQLKHSDLNPLMIFIRPPSIQELERRLRLRNTETEQSIIKRLAIVKKELEYGSQPGNYHYIVTNDKFEKSYHTFKQLIFDNLELTI